MSDIREVDPANNAPPNTPWPGKVPAGFHKGTKTKSIGDANDHGSAYRFRGEDPAKEDMNAEDPWWPFTDDDFDKSDMIVTDLSTQGGYLQPEQGPRKKRRGR